MKVRAPAKVNLQLKIHGRRPDSFHDIETLIIPLSLADELTVEISAGARIDVQCDDPDVPEGRSNLAATAAHEFAQFIGRQFGVDIRIRKRIPMGAGLGGGSSNAAAVLLALDAMLETHLAGEELEKLAARLGSDVPFFIRGAPAMCRGRGEVIELFDVPEKLNFLLVKPPFAVETPWAYNAWDSLRTFSGGFEDEQDLGWIKVSNSLERPVFEKFLLLPVMKDWLKRQPEVRAAAMSGSGSTIFALLRSESPDPDLAQRVKANFGETLWTAFCEGVNKSDTEKR